MQNIITWIKQKNKSLVIANHSILTEIKTELSRQNLFLDIVLKTQDEIIRDVLGTYKQEAMFFYAKSKHTPLELFHNYQTFFPYLKNCKDDNVLHLIQTKQDLRPFLKRHPHKLKRYSTREVLLVEENPLSNEWRFVKDILQDQFVVTHLQIEEIKSNIEYYEFADAKEEAMHVVFEIAKLLGSGIDPNHIKVHIPTDSYLPLLEEVFYLYDIDISKLRKATLSTQPFFLKWIQILKTTSMSDSLLDTIELSIKHAAKSLPNVSKRIINQVIQVINTIDLTKFDLPSFLEFVSEAAQTIKVQQQQYTNTIEVGDFTFAYVKPISYFFVLGFAQNLIPKVYLDEDFLTDEVKKELEIITSEEKNAFIKQHWRHKLQTIQESRLSFSYHVFNNAFVKSSFLETLCEENKVQVKTSEFETLRYSKKQDEMLYGKYVDKRVKYDIIDENMKYLEPVFFNAPYRMYDNQFDGMDQNELTHYLENTFTLSYTALDLYYNCPFAYYLEKVLRIRRTTNAAALFTGNVYHAVLEVYLKENREVEVESIKDFILAFSNEHENPLGIRMHFYLEKYAQDLVNILETIKNQQNQSEFVVKGYEDTLTIRLENDYQTKMSGKVDKLMTFHFKGKTYAIVVDYKTGNTSFDYTYIENGLDMQTLIYFYLYKKSGRDFSFGGAYLQSVFLNPMNEDIKKEIDELVWDALKLSGYTNASVDLLEKMDKDIRSHTFIDKMAFKKDGSFTAHAEKRTLTDETFESLLNYVEKKIYEGVEKIEQGKFLVSPIQVGSKDACRYCPYQDLCFKRESNYIKKDKAEDLSFVEAIGGEKDE